MNAERLTTKSRDVITGATPGIVSDGSHHDANLWIKAPGESDGQCNGGPVAGAWWPTSALELTRNAGW